ncbi:MAG: type III secretion system export apparatus subunit SctR [Pseudomonadota bacterium]
MPEAGSPALVSLMALTVSLGLLTFFVVTTTSFIKIAVVLFIVRNAIGIQQTPPNIVLYGIALALTAFVTAPMFTEMAEAVFVPDMEFQDFGDWMAAFDRAKEPVRAFLMRFTDPDQRSFFLLASEQVWPEGETQPFTETDLSVLIPSFLVMELQRAFEIGFLLYLPMIVIDLVVTTVLMAMGMSMVSPTTIATPLKLFLFVSISGWGRLVEGLVMTYSNTA